ncbi:SGNH/GDSL hydrolase family protein [Curtobacterium sp. SL109]|uniref:SGNH/GDSL hydrolase family protein n=1 Tax=Curtobacterium sp. SL109 TaxID=2994662 RepID=UPI0022748DD7|nr:SGNH/GDSL hydrolase family protein [Curtobacterium sp. SL109]MCY1694132.1 SGNH/GDSL hydrolase family protein [Curtobacterium sp. SL109]
MKLTRNRAIALGCAIVAIVGLTAGAYKARVAYISHEGCESVRAYEKSVGPVQVIGKGAKRITVIGDSYSTGDMLSDRADAWVDDFASEQDATVSVLAQGGTGYTNAGFCGDSTFGSRVRQVAATDPQLVIVEGGLNDTAATEDEERTAAERVLRSLRGHNVVVVGPVDVPVLEGEGAVDLALSGAARAEGARYISALGWPIALGADKKHPTAAGHAEFAQRVAAAIASA